MTAGGMEAGHSHVHVQQPGSSQQQEAGQHVMGRKRHREDAVAGVDGQVQAGEEGQEEVQTAGPGPDKQGGGKKRKMFVHGNYQKWVLLGLARNGCCDTETARCGTRVCRMQLCKQLSTGSMLNVHGHA